MNNTSKIRVLDVFRLWFNLEFQLLRSQQQLSGENVVKCENEKERKPRERERERERRNVLIQPVCPKWKGGGRGNAGCQALTLSGGLTDLGLREREREKVFLQSYNIRNMAENYKVD